MLTRTFEFKLKPTAEQVSTMKSWLIACRKVYNYALEERKAWVNSRKCEINSCSLEKEYIIPADTKRPTYYTQCKALTQARKDFEELGNVHVHVLQHTLKRLENAFVAMWDRGYGFPRFKSTKRMRSFTYPQLGKSPLDPPKPPLLRGAWGDGGARKRGGIGAVKLPKIGWVKICVSLDQSQKVLN